MRVQLTHLWKQGSVNQSINFMGKFEQQAIDNSLLKPFIQWRFIDDIFMIWTHGEEHPKSFIGFLNSIHPSIKFTHEYSNSLHQILPFLDVQVHLINNHIETDLHTKPTDKQLQQLGPLPDNAILVTLDVSSLYTNIPHNEGIDACRYFLNTRQDKSLPAEKHL